MRRFQLAAITVLFSLCAIVGVRQRLSPAHLGDVVYAMSTAMPVPGVSPYAVAAKSGTGFPIPGSGLAKSGTGFPIPGSGLAKSGTGFTIQGSGLAKSGTGFPIPGSGLN
ncbi:MAG: hypothetical protein ACRD2H_11660 [Terriglobales bacterium]